MTGANSYDIIQYIYIIKSISNNYHFEWVHLKIEINNENLLIQFFSFPE